MDFQTRTESGVISNHQTMNDALNYAEECIKHKDLCWKISFTIPETNERIRLVRSDKGWVLEDVYGEGTMRGI